MTEHARLARRNGSARRYPADVLPFAGLPDLRPGSFEDLYGLLAPEESIHVSAQSLGDTGPLLKTGEVEEWQMAFAGRIEDVPDSRPGIQVRRLGPEDAPRMLALTDAAFPGFFRARTPELGTYYGIEEEGRLVARGGERAAFPGAREISALCTHPDHAGKGYATLLIGRLLRDHAILGIESFLHVSATNARAIGLYERLGFVKTGRTAFHRLQRRA